MIESLFSEFFILIVLVLKNKTSDSFDWMGLLESLAHT